MRVITAIGVLCFSLCACAAAQKTTIDWDRSENFGSFHTYMWQPSPNPANGLLNERIIGQIDKQLQAKGLRRVEYDPDLYVVYSKTLQKNHTVLPGGGYVLGPGWGGRPAVPPTAVVFTSGTLFVEMEDTKTKQITWQGSVADTISDKAEKNAQMIDKAIAKLFKDYPPKPKK